MLPKQVTRSRRLAGETPVNEQDIFYVGRSHGHCVDGAPGPVLGYIARNYSNLQVRERAGALVAQLARAALAATPNALVQRLNLIEQLRVVGDEA